jgi:hypothetical protein
LNSSNINGSERHGYRVQQTTATIANKSVPQLTLTLWSGKLSVIFFVQKNQEILFFYLDLSMQCQIIGENLDCILLLPEKFREHIEGLVGNFNGNYSDDLYNRLTNQSVAIPSASDITTLYDDADVLSACLSCKFILKINTNHHHISLYRETF